MPENVYIHELNLGLLEANVLRKLWQQFDEETDGTALAGDQFTWLLW
jgi:hypothetical protein